MADWKAYDEKIDIENGYAVIMFTDHFEIAKYPITDIETEEKLIKDFNSKLLDMRIYDDEKEYRIFRGDITKGFFFRMLDDSYTEIKYDDEQFLDIDEVRSESAECKGQGMVMATGGGKYKILAELRNKKIHIRNYIDFDESGQAYIKDWRLYSK